MGLRIQGFRWLGWYRAVGEGAGALHLGFACFSSCSSNCWCCWPPAHCSSLVLWASLGQSQHLARGIRKQAAREAVGYGMVGGLGWVVRGVTQYR
jgi:hypothetical protein